MSLVGKDMAVKLELLRSITNNFSEELKVGTGGYGNVYRAIYEGKEIAVKKFHSLVGRLDDKEFDNEVLNLREIQHQNIVRLLGYCYVSEHKYIERKGRLPTRAEHVDRVLCFEYMQGSLDKHISDESCDLDWATSYKIIRGICEGLKHLHTAGNPIFHMDLKPANILLDKNMTAKIGDLGLSKLVASTETHTTEILKGTQGYMPPEYINDRKVSSKFDVFSLGVIIIKMLAGNKAYYSRREMPPEEFIKFVTEKWMEKLQGTCLSRETDILQVKTCVNIALRCVKDERKERPDIKGIVNELEKLEARVKKILLASDQSKNLIGLQSTDSNVITVDPALELRFLFEPRKDITCCLQLTNKTSDSIAFNIKTNQTKYYAEPSRGIMAPCSKRYVSVTLRAQEDAPPNMQCHDMLIVQSVNLSKEQASSSDEEITEDFFEKVMMEKVVDVVTRPIVYIARDQLRASASLTANNGQAQERESRVNRYKRALESETAAPMETS